MTRDSDDGQSPDRESGSAGRRSGRQRREEESRGIYAPPRRSDGARLDDADDGRKRPGIFSRLTGRHRIDEIREERLKPYQYESNAQTLRWTGVLMTIWCVLMVYLAFTDWQNGRRYAEWLNDGIETIPPSSEFEAQIEPARLAAWRDGGEAMQCAFLGGRQSSPECPEGELPLADVDAFVQEQDYLCFQRDAEVDACSAVWSSRGIVEFARIEGFDCPDGRAVFDSVSGAGPGWLGCEEVFDIGDEFASTQGRSQLIWLLVVVVGLVVAFPYLSTVHRASRNLLTLRSEGQKHRPEWAVLHHFIPAFNVVMPGLVIRELFMGSDPRVGQAPGEDWNRLGSDPGVGEEDGKAWKRLGRNHPIAFVWHFFWFFGLVMNPVILPRIFGASNLSELVRTNNLLMIGDLVLVGLGVAGWLLLRQLHMWQERRHAMVGDIMVTPPQPIDPLEAEIAKRDRDRKDDD